MHFARPEQLWWLLAVAALALLEAPRGRLRAARLAAFAREPMIRHLASDYSVRRDRLKSVLILAALVLLVVAASGPQWGSRMVVVERRGVDVMLCVDCSASMNAQDVKPSRLEVARRELGELVKQLEGNRLGLVGFAGSSFTFCPLTLDVSATSMFLDQLDTGSMPIPGTSIGDAIRQACQSFPKGDPNKKIVVLLTDGEDHHSGPIDAAKGAAKDGVTIHTVGIGDPNGEPIPEIPRGASQASTKDQSDAIGVSGHKEARGNASFRINDASGRSQYVRDAAGKVVMSRLDDATLKEVAKVSGGTYIHVDGTSPEALAPIVAAVGGAEKKTLAETLQRRYAERFQIFVALAFALLALERLIPTRRQSARRPARAAAMISGVLTLLLTLTMAGPLWAAPAVDASQQRDAPVVGVVHGPLTRLKYVRAMQRGKAAYDRGDFASAQEEFRAALRHWPGSSEALNDLGEAQYRAGKLADSAQSFQNAAELTDARVRSRTDYNLGNALFRQNKLREAADAYKKALREDERDDDARHNLQVVLEKLKQQRKPQDKRQQDAKNQSKGNKQQARDKQGKSQPQKQQAHDKQGKSQPQNRQAQNKQGKSQQQKQQAVDDRARRGARASPRKNSFTRDDADRILQYFQEKERAAKVKPQPMSPFQPRAGEETW